MIRAVLWDIDNTLLDFDVAERVALNKDFEGMNAVPGILGI